MHKQQYINTRHLKFGAVEYTKGLLFIKLALKYSVQHLLMVY
jgi:hypothetical protein